MTVIGSQRGKRGQSGCWKAKLLSGVGGRGEYLKKKSAFNRRHKSKSGKMKNWEGAQKWETRQQFLH